MNELLINEVIKQIKEDVVNEDYTAIEELLQLIPERNLRAFLPELDRMG
jgi:hypothetical protein